MTQHEKAMITEPGKPINGWSPYQNGWRKCRPCNTWYSPDSGILYCPKCGKKTACRPRRAYKWTR